MPLTLPGSMKFARSGLCCLVWISRKGAGKGVLTSVLVYLHSTQHSDVNSSTSDHAETFVATKCGSALDQSDSLFARVDQIWVFLAGLGVAAHA
jgi:hypothetical protein